LRLEYTTRWRQPTVQDRDPQTRRIPASLSLFEDAARPPLTQERQESDPPPVALE
jgi:hypothetical protein